jgi:hypothetical protein
MAITRALRVRWKAESARTRRIATARRPITGTTSKRKMRTVKRLPRSMAREYSKARLAPLDGLLDWYLLGVVLGLGTADGTAAVGARRSAVLAVLALTVLAGAAVITALALSWWALAAFAGAALLARLGLARLSLQALPAAAVGAAALAAVPAAGYLLAVTAPLAGARLGRRAGSRFAGLRILAKD